MAPHFYNGLFNKLIVNRAVSHYKPVLLVLADEIIAEGMCDNTLFLQVIRQAYIGQTVLEVTDNMQSGIIGIDSDFFLELSIKSLEKQAFPLYGYLCLLYTSPSPRDATLSRMPSSA